MLNMLQSNPLQESHAAHEGHWPLTLLSIGMCVGWLANYIAMIHKSFQDRTYGMALMPLCCNIACEFVYGLIYPPDITIWPYIFASWLALNFMVIYAAIKFAPNEWSHAPLVKQNLPWIFAVSIVIWMSAHLALVAHVGQSSAAAWSSWFCQLQLSAGGLCQLIVRGDTRGTSFFIW
jgi:paspaline synthase